MATNQDPIIDVSGTSPSEHSLARAVVYRFLSCAYRYPNQDALRDISALESAVATGLGVLTDPGNGSVEKCFKDFQKSLAAQSHSDTELAYTSVFGHAVRGICPPYEVEYGESEEGLQQPHELGDIAAFYRAFGLEIAPISQERVDFVAVECEFLSYLCQKEAYAIERGDTALLEACRDAQKKFLQDHLGRWVPAFAQRVIQRGGGDFYRPLARFTLEFITSECKHLAVCPGPEHLRLRIPLKFSDTCMTCPSGEQSLPSPINIET